ncbi:ras-GEF domain-containing family member 1B-like isoform X2 [Branchiostoma lanceolatum]|uniref:ras-GEF domain-containing family member 1B-like isoform X2 n=1 Tax=Branchiostoma lanceolatum TaxID=7740 RepID=UPI003452E2B4
MGSDLLAIQLEVTSMLLDAERRKLLALQREMGALQRLSCPGDINPEQVSDLERQQLNHSRIKLQYERLEQEYRFAAQGIIRRSSVSQKSRSQPSLGMKTTPKSRPSIFGTLTKERSPKNKRRLSMPQTSARDLTTVIRLSAGESNGGVSTETGENELDASEALIYQDGNLVSGSLEALTQHLVPTPDYYPERTYIFAFLLSSRLFIKPHELLEEVCKQCRLQMKLTEDRQDKAAEGRLGSHIVQLISEWTEVFAYDFRDDRMLKHLKDITQRCSIINENQRKTVGQIMQTLVRKLSVLDKYEHVLTKINANLTDRLRVLKTNPHAIQKDILNVCNDPVVMAQQLTHIEMERISHIGPEEFVQSFVSKDVAEWDERTLFQDMKKTSNLEAYVEWFNRLSYMVATEICMPVKKKHRARVIEFFIDVARECFNIGNFNSLMAIIAGLNMSPVARLKKTWSKVDTCKFDVLEHQMDPTSNFSNYRASLMAALHRAAGAHSNRERIVIPFFSLMVKDIYFLNETCSNKLPNGHVRFEKFWQLARQVTSFCTWQQVECPFERHRKVLNYLLTAPVFYEDSLHLVSFDCEGPENHLEKERFKTLKSQLLDQ